MKKILMILLAALGFASGGIQAQNVAPRAEARLDSAKMLMGNLLKMKVSITAPGDSAKIDFPLIEQLQGKRYVGLLNDTIEVVNPYTVDTIKATGGGTEFIFKFYIQAFDSGKYVLPPFQIKIDGQPVETNALNLEVLPVKVKADDKIDPFTGPVEPFELLPEGALQDEKPENNWIIWLIIGCVVILAILIFLYIRFRQTGSILLRKPLAPYQVAIKQLDKLQSQKLWEKGKVKTYYTRLTDIIRRYLNREFGIKTLERTTTEILNDVAENPEVEMFTQTLTRIFATADFVKFAKVNPTEEENTGSIREAREFILESRPLEKEGPKSGENYHKEGDKKDSVTLRKGGER